MKWKNDSKIKVVDVGRIEQHGLAQDDLVLANLNSFQASDVGDAGDQRTLVDAVGDVDGEVS